MWFYLYDFYFFLGSIVRAVKTESRKNRTTSGFYLLVSDDVTAFDWIYYFLAGNVSCKKQTFIIRYFELNCSFFKISNLSVKSDVGMKII